MNMHHPSGRGGFGIYIGISLLLWAMPLTLYGQDSVVSLDWDDNAEADFNHYNIYRSATSGGPYQKINTAPVTISDYEDTGLVLGTTYYYVVTAVDATGNESPYSTEVAHTTAEETPPSFDDAQAAPALAREGTAVTLTFTASESLAANPTVTVNGQAASFQSQSDTAYTYQYTVSASEAEGPADIVITGTSAGGVEGTASVTGVFQVDRTAPGAAMTAPTGSTSQTVVTVAATGQDPESNGYASGVAAIEVFWNRNGGAYTSLGRFESDTVNTSFDAQATGGAGTYGFYAVASDRAGNTSPPPDAPQVSVTIDNTPPLFLGVAAEPRRAKGGMEVTVRLTASEALSELTVLIHDSPTSQTDLQDLLYTFVYPVDAADPDGDAPIIVYGRDREGNASTTTVTAQLTIDNTAPAVPGAIQATAGENQVTLSWEAAMEADFDQYEVSRGSAAGGPFTSVSPAGLAETTFTDTGLENGQTYYYVLRAVDTLGNTSADSASVAATPVDMTPPAAPTNLRVVPAAE